MSNARRVSDAFHSVVNMQRAMRIIHFFISAIFPLLNARSSTIDLSVPSSGWRINQESPYLCHLNHLCTPSRRMWETNSTLYFSNDACELLTNKGIKRLHFIGDSYIRHIFQALILTLTGNYRNSTLIRPDKSCEFHSLFDESYCSRDLSVKSKNVCNGRVSLIYHNNPNQKCIKGDVYLWSEGNHRVNPSVSNRYGINNASAYSAHYLNDSYKNSWRDGHKPHPLCPQAKETYSICPTYWISTHARISARYEDEKEQRTDAFNREMRTFMESNKCGPMGYLDVYNMTRSLVQDFPDDAKLMSFDGMHWGMEVNLVKAQIFLYQIEKDNFPNFKEAIEEKII